RTDRGVDHPFFLLTQVVLAARQPDFASALQAAGIAVSASLDVFDLSAGFSDAADRRLRSVGRSDLGEMAQLAAVASLTALLGRTSPTFCEPPPDAVLRAPHGLSTRSGFAALAHDFFARFARRFLTYPLGRELGLHVGGNGRFADTAAHDEFVERLDVHCR